MNTETPEAMNAADAAAEILQLWLCIRDEVREIQDSLIRLEMVSDPKAQAHFFARMSMQFDCIQEKAGEAKQLADAVEALYKSATWTKPTC